jgi:hypothetical protein
MKTSLIAFLIALKSFVPSAWAHDPDHHDIHLVFARAGLHAHISWLNGGPVGNGQESFLRVQFHNANTHSPTEITPLNPEIMIWMPDMDHGSAPTALQREMDSNGRVVVGSYIVSNIYFVMKGRWDVHVSLKNKSNILESKSFRVDINDGPDHGPHSN